MKHPRSSVSTVVLGLFFVASSLSALQGQEAVPTGKVVTPTAAKGSTFHRLNPGLAAFPNFVAGQAVTTSTSPNGKTLLILTSGFNRNNDAAGNQVDAASTEFVFVYDISVNPPTQKQVLQVPNTFNGMVWNPNGKEFYVSAGPPAAVLLFSLVCPIWTNVALIPL